MTDWFEYSYIYTPRTDRIKHLPVPPKGFFWADNGTARYWLRTSSGPQGGVGFVAAEGRSFDIHYTIYGVRIPDDLGYTDIQDAAQRLIDVAMEHRDILPTQSRQGGTRRGESLH